MSGPPTDALFRGIQVGVFFPRFYPKFHSQKITVSNLAMVRRGDAR
jgi:hypothetical protein